MALSALNEGRSPKVRGVGTFRGGGQFLGAWMLGGLAVGLLAFWSLAPVALDPAKRSRQAFVFKHAYFTLALPNGWYLAEFRPGRTKRFMPIAAVPEGTGQVHFANGNGYYFSVFVDQATDFEADAVWEVAMAPDGFSVRVLREGAACKRPPDPRYEGPCSAGNGTLEIGTLPPLEMHGHTYAFYFGSTKQETGVGLAVFRTILGTFRVR